MTLKVSNRRVETPVFSSAAVKSLRIKTNNTMIEKQDYLHAGDSPAFLHERSHQKKRKRFF